MLTSPSTFSKNIPGLFSNNRGIQLFVLFEGSCYRTVGSIGSVFVLFILFFCACFCSRPVQTKLVPINGGPDMPGFAELVPCHVSRVPACPMGAVCDVFTSMPWLTLCKVRSSFSFPFFSRISYGSTLDVEKGEQSEEDIYIARTNLLHHPP